MSRLVTIPAAAVRRDTEGCPVCGGELAVGDPGRREAWCASCGWREALGEASVPAAWLAMHPEVRSAAAAMLRAQAAELLRRAAEIAAA